MANDLPDGCVSVHWRSACPCRIGLSGTCSNVGRRDEGILDLVAANCNNAVRLSSSAAFKVRDNLGDTATRGQLSEH